MKLNLIRLRSRRELLLLRQINNHGITSALDQESVTAIAETQTADGARRSGANDGLRERSGEGELILREDVGVLNGRTGRKTHSDKQNDEDHSHRTIKPLSQEELKARTLCGGARLRS